MSHQITMMSHKVIHLPVWVVGCAYITQGGNCSGALEHLWLDDVVEAGNDG